MHVTLRRSVSCAGLFLVSLCVLSAQSAKSLDIYFIDTEGGQATLIVSPSGESLLIDAGYPGDRDADRIAAAAKLAGVTRIDQLLITHHHTDHEGGVPDLIKRLPVRTFLDHGPSVESDDNPAWTPALKQTRDAAVKAQDKATGRQGRNVLVEVRDAYEAYLKASAAGPRRMLVPGDTIAMTGVDIRVVTSGGTFITGAGTANPFCDGLAPRDEVPAAVWENPQSVGIVLQFGQFRFVDLGDLPWNASLDFFCPENRIPPIDLYLSPHHGTGATPKAEWAMRPRVTVMNNGARKGGDPPSWQTLRNSPGLEDLWQLHTSIAGGVEHNAPARFIANVDEQCEGHYLKASALPDGSFSIYNSRTRETERYGRR